MSIQQWYQFIQSSVTTQPISNTTPNEDVLCDLSHLGLLKISGADASAFLQGQVTNDIKLLHSHQAHFTGYCNPKGRLIALFFAWADIENIYLQMPKALVEPIAKRLKMYVMRSKVEIQDASETLVKFGLNGTRTVKLLSALFDTLPQQDYVSTTHQNTTIIRLPSAQAEQSRFEIITDITRAKTIWQVLSQQAQPTNASVWDWLEIQAGIPDVTLATQEEFVPQMLNLDLIGGINFKKGCYTGQEIVARTHYLGSIKRRTHLAHIQAENAINAGDNIQNSAGETVGKIVRSAPSPNGGYDVLAEIRLEAVAAGDCLVNHSALNIGKMPYSL